MRKNHPTSKKFNNHLELSIAGARSTAIEMKDSFQKESSAKVIKAELERANEIDSLAFAQDYIDTLDVRDHYWQWKKANTVINKFKNLLIPLLYRLRNSHQHILRITSHISSNIIRMLQILYIKIYQLSSLIKS